MSCVIIFMPKNESFCEFRFSVCVPLNFTTNFMLTVRMGKELNDNLANFQSLHKFNSF